MRRQTVGDTVTEDRIRFLGRRRAQRRRSQLVNLAWVVFDRGWRLMLSFFVTLLAARIYGPDGFGVLSFGLALAAIAQPIAGFGMDQIVVREILDAESSAMTVVGTAALTRLTGALAAIAVAVPLAAVAGPGTRDRVAIVALLTAPILFQMFDPIEFFYQARGRADIAARARIFGSLLAMGLRVVLITQHVSVVTFAATYIVDAAVPSLILLVTFRKYSLRSLRWHTAVMRRLVREGWPLVVSAMSIVLYGRIDQIMLASMAGADETGKYAASTRISELFNLFPAATLAVLAPILLSVRADADRLRHHRQAMFEVFGIAGVVVSVVNIALAPISVPLLFGHSFDGAVVMLQIQAASAIFVYLGLVQSISNIADGRQIVGMRAVAVALVVNVGLNFVLIPTWGGAGAAAATLVAYALASTFAYPLVSSCRYVPREQFSALGRAVTRPGRSLRSFVSLVRQA